MRPKWCARCLTTGLFSHESHFQPETAVNKEQETILNTAVPVPTLVNSAAGAAGSLAGWAISSISKKVFTLVNHDPSYSLYKSAGGI